LVLAASHDSGTRAAERAGERLINDIIGRVPVPT